MTAKLDYRWKLREIMATRGLFSTISLQGPLAERGIELSSSQVYRLVTERPERLSLKVLMALQDILECRMDDLIEPIASAASGSTPRKRAVGDAEASVGEFRPKRARIVRGRES
jgi:DNA-binding Xre family transcriptional regulator